MLETDILLNVIVISLFDDTTLSNIVAWINQNTDMEEMHLMEALGIAKRKWNFTY